MLFNELYILTDGGSFWGRPEDSSPDTPDSFALLECYLYPYYATLDVRFYGSLPLIRFWPKIDKRVLTEFADTVPRQWPEKGLWVWKTELTGKPVIHIRKKIGAVPHDLGVPAGDPFVSVNEPGWQDTNNWKDLNSKFVLMVYRDYVFTGRTDTAFLRHTWPAVQDAIQYLRQFDHGGGVPENSGYPDQTYDDWVAKGVSAYSGGLWLSALRAAQQIAQILGDSAAERDYNQLFLKGQKTYISKLWNGSFFRYDTEPDNQDAIQADQLAGQWYANMLGLGNIVPRSMQIAALHSIYVHNLLEFDNGTMGAVNGITTSGKVVDNPEGKEVWVGVNWALAALMKSEGMKPEAYKMGRDLYRVIYQTKGYWFRTPEAWDSQGNFRASMYIRPPAIWAMEMTPSVVQPQP
jgi:non-lysosomal glucosylceramidase